ncbi:short chain dehydrogenase [Bordetella pertussis]|nr:short chain dehydrogenase [Bordetella pertussis]
MRIFALPNSRDRIRIHQSMNFDGQQSEVGVIGGPRPAIEIGNAGPFKFFVGPPFRRRLEFSLLATGAGSGTRGMYSGQRHRTGPGDRGAAGRRGLESGAARRTGRPGRAGRVPALGIDLGAAADIATIAARLGVDYDEVGAYIHCACAPPAGVATEPSVALALQAWDAALAIHLEAPLLISQLLVRPMLAKGWGRVLFVGEHATIFPTARRRRPSLVR